MADYPARVHWCLAIGAPILADKGLQVEQLGGWDREGIARARGEQEIEAHATGFLAELGLANRAELMAWARERLHGGEEKAHAMARLVAAVGWSVWVGWLPDEDALQIALVAGKLVQDAYRSWEEVAGAYARAAGRPVPPEVLARWSAMPWDQALDVTLFQPGAQHRVLRSTCPACSAQRRRPTTSVYVYCDHCGALMDYDLGVAMEHPAAPPGPVLTAIYERYQPGLNDEFDRHSRGGYRDVLREIYTAWVEACPHAVPIRCKDPAYRTKYVGWLVEADAVSSFDRDATDKEYAMKREIENLVFAQVDGRTRVASAPFRAMADAMFAYEARRDELFRPAVYAMSPDGASRELQRRFGFSMFVQGWLPMLDEAEAAALVERTGLHCEYTPYDPVATRAFPCSHCGGPLELVEGARRVVCDHCGHLVDLV